MEPINVISCFDGLSGGMLALKRAGIPVRHYYAYEIDKYAIQIATKNNPEIEEYGDIRNWRQHVYGRGIPDLILAGSPCQGFSVSAEARAQGFEDVRSGLFYTFVDMLKYWQGINPNVKFLLENVKMKKAWRDQITDILGVEPVLINSELVSAQSRPRYYWANWTITQPEDRHITLDSILEDGEAVREKGYCIDANYWKGGSPKDAQGHVSFKHQRARRAMVYMGGERDNPACYRKLTPWEVEKMQTVPVGYTEGVSNTQRYKMLGNGWTIEVIAHILKEMK